MINLNLEKMSENPEGAFDVSLSPHPRYPRLSNENKLESCFVGVVTQQSHLIQVELLGEHSIIHQSCKPNLLDVS